MKKASEIPIKIIEDLVQIDCYQNLFALILNYMNTDICRLGFCWPWEFKIKSTENAIHIMDTELVQPKLYPLYFGAKQHCVDFQDSAFDFIKCKISSGTPVISSFDEYYSYYHYKHIYRKQHGDHAILLTGYNDEKEELSFISAIPPYQGTLSYCNYLQGVNSHITPKLYYFTNMEDSLYSPKNFIKFFHSRVSEINNQYSVPTFPDLRGQYIQYSPQLLEVVKGIAGGKHIFTMLNGLLVGTWLWHIDRKGKWLIYSLKREKLKDANNIISLVEANNKMWLRATRLLVRASLKSDVKDINRGISIIEEIIPNERILLEHLELITR